MFVEADNGVLLVRIAHRGAALCGMWCNGYDHSLVLGTNRPDVFLNAHPFGGTVVGPVANRVAGGQVRVGAESYQMPLNEPFACLHSGPDGLHARHWELSRAASEITARCTLEDGACGLPGRRDITAQYVLAADTLTVTLSARSDADTVMNLALHPYFNLDGSDTLHRHRLTVGGTHVLETKDALPTGQLLPIASAGLSATPAPLGGPVDHNVCLTRAPAAVLEVPGGPRLTITTDAPGLQVYDGRHLPRVPGSLGAPIGPGAGLALEAQMWPNAPSHDHFPPITLAAGTVWQQVTTYKFEF